MRSDDGTSRTPEGWVAEPSPLTVDGQIEVSVVFDLAYTNGVFHHIPPQMRAGAVDLLFRSLRPGGVLSFWENNPWNPETRYVMSRIPFDRSAETRSASAAGRLLRRGKP